MYFTQYSCTKEDEDCSIGRKGDGLRFLGFKRYDLHRILLEALCSVIIGRFDTELQEKRSHLAKKKVLFRHDNAPAHNSAIAIAKLAEVVYEILPHSPDLALCDFFLFQNLKTHSTGRHFSRMRWLSPPWRARDLQKTFDH